MKTQQSNSATGIGMLLFGAIIWAIIATAHNGEGQPPATVYEEVTPSQMATAMTPGTTHHHGHHRER